MNIRKEAIIPIFIKLATLGKCISSEVVVDDVAMLNEWKDEVIFVDMESW
ncbi:MAG: hypothetical protein LBD11_02470 [Candidatus Peribacteria bacterium]|nr:hypothetical protein [Candidatus Peribacteria bacterium]